MGLKSGAILGLLSALLFGVSSPLAKLLLLDMPPLLLSGLLYIGAGLALSLFLLFRRVVSAGAPAEARLRRGDVWPLLGIVVTGGIAGPALMLLGLSRVSAVTGALLLNLGGFALINLLGLGRALRAA